MDYYIYIYTITNLTRIAFFNVLEEQYVTNVTKEISTTFNFVTKRSSSQAMNISVQSYVQQ